MQGRGPIVLRLENHGFHEHFDRGAAEREAQRLAEVTQGECVVYIPVYSAAPAPKVVTKVLDSVQADYVILEPRF